ncbi:hypothetical protein GX441_10925 [bacterium]|nr:hypothetical protein [bacterium]
MRSESALYHEMLFREITKAGWFRCLIWGSVKAVLEGFLHFLNVANVLVRVSIGLVWIGIIAPALVLFIATFRSAKILGFEQPYKFFIAMEIVFLVSLVAQLPLIFLGLFFHDGFVTIFSLIIVSLAGYNIKRDLEQRGWNKLEA